MVETKRRAGERRKFIHKTIRSFLFFSAVYLANITELPALVFFIFVCYFVKCALLEMLVPVSSNVNCSRHREKKERKLFDVRSCENNAFVMMILICELFLCPPIVSYCSMPLPPDKSGRFSFSL